MPHLLGGGDAPLRLGEGERLLLRRGGGDGKRRAGGDMRLLPSAPRPLQSRTVCMLMYERVFLSVCVCLCVYV